MIARLTRNADTLRRTLLDLVFPPRCVACRRAGDWFCAACRQAIQKILPPLCNQCGRPMPPARRDRPPSASPAGDAEPSPLSRSECPYCQKLPLHIDGTRAAAFFEGTLRDAIHAFKYSHRPELAQPLGALLHDYLSTFPLPADALVAIPLHRERERARGYNQSLLLARALGEQCRLPVWEDALARTRATRPQVELDAPARRENVRAAFVASARASGARVLLIDDVCTTGATMDACGIALKERGAKSVWGLAIARSR